MKEYFCRFREHTNTGVELLICKELPKPSGVISENNEFSVNVDFCLNEKPIILINNVHPSVCKNKVMITRGRASLSHVPNMQSSRMSTLLCDDTHE